MGDSGCVAFLQWALPQMGMRWPGFRRVRRQVCRRIRARLHALGLHDHAAYRAHLQGDPTEWTRLDDLCRVTISRFYRDQQVFRRLASLVDDLAVEGTVRVWCAGCASGEEPYSVAMALWGRPTSIVATDADAHMLARANAGTYPSGTLRELTEAEVARFFEPHADGYTLRPQLRGAVHFEQQDIRRDVPPGPFDLIFCRNMAFTYFDADTQRRVLERIGDVAARSSALIVGAHEVLPQPLTSYARWEGYPHTFARQDPVDVRG